MNLSDNDVKSNSLANANLKLLPVCADCGIEQLSLFEVSCHCCQSRAIKLEKVSVLTVQNLDIAEVVRKFKQSSK